MYRCITKDNINKENSDNISLVNGDEKGLRETTLETKVHNEQHDSTCCLP